MKRVNITMTARLHARCQRFAQRNDSNVSQMARNALLDYLDRKQNDGIPRDFIWVKEEFRKNRQINEENVEKISNKIEEVSDQLNQQLRMSGRTEENNSQQKAKFAGQVEEVLQQDKEKTWSTREITQETTLQSFQVLKGCNYLKNKYSIQMVDSGTGDKLPKWKIRRKE